MQPTSSPTDAQEQTPPVVVRSLPEMDYTRDYVALPPTYGTAAYEAREDVRAITAAVHEALDALDARTGFTAALPGYKRVFVKPNLVAVYHNAGLLEADYPASTDPRVLDAVITYLQRFTDRIVIAESAGKPLPTPVCFHLSGLRRLARHRGVALCALERRPVERYALPRAQVMREVYLPDVMGEVVRGESLYVSVPKLKSNLYTGVTLSMKGNMGLLPYFMRERNHTYHIHEKLADLLYLLRPGLTIVDAVVGGDGNTPAPVLPRAVGAVVCSCNALAADRVATRLMGLAPESIALYREAAARWGAPVAEEVVGDVRPVPFVGANPSLMDEGFRAQFPGVLALAGHTKHGAPAIQDVRAVTPETARALEGACVGGCLSALRSGFEYVTFSAPHKRGFPLAVVIGEGVCVAGERYWFDAAGKPYTASDIAALPMPKLTMGNCAAGLEHLAKYKVRGCCDPAQCMLAACAAAGVMFPLLSPRNRSLLRLVASLVGTVWHKLGWLARGRWVDCPMRHEDRIFDIPESLDDGTDWVAWPLPPLRGRERLRRMADQFTLFRL